MAITIEQQRWDYLGNLRSKLGDLRGLSTLAFELLQNADDAPGVTRLTLDVRDEALLVRNDGVFRPIDFQRMKSLGSGGKRDEEDTTGSFGIGFISVYLITDNPTLTSAGQRWSFHPERDGQIEIDDAVADDGETVFSLPWAFDQSSAVRQALGIAAVDVNIQDLFLGELSAVLPEAMLFLRKVEKIQLNYRGSACISIEKLPGDNGEVYMQVSRVGRVTEGRLWRIWSGDFGDAEQQLRVTFPGFIEPKRKSIVQLAVPQDVEGIEGLFCATLPSQQATGFPIHVNAHFYPSSDRKRIIFEDGSKEFMALWNRAAVRASAWVFRDGLSEVLDFVGDVGFWRMLRQVKAIHDSARTREAEIPGFWREIKAALPGATIVKSVGDQRHRASECVLLLVEHATDYYDAVREMGFEVVHPDLVEFSTLLQTPAIGVRTFTVQLLTCAFTANGLDKAVAISEAPAWLATDEGRRSIGWLAEALLKTTPQGAALDTAKESLKGCAIALGVDGKLHPPRDLFDATKEQVKLFGRVSGALPFLAHGQAEILRDMVQPFSVPAALAVLEGVPAPDLQKAWQQDASLVNDLITFFENQQGAFTRNEQHRDRLFKLPIYPSGGSLHALTELLVPGDFQDPLDSTSILDLNSAGGHREFLLKLGARQLDFAVYARDRMPLLLNERSDISVAAKRSLVMLLAEERLRLVDKDDVLRRLTTTAIVECADGIFRTPGEVYLRSKSVTEILGADAHVANEDVHKSIAVQELYRWLGVTDRPRAPDLVRRVKGLIASEPKGEVRKQVQGIFDHLSVRWPEEQAQLEPRLGELLKLRWLPERNNESGWHTPDTLYASYQVQLFHTQAAFLDAITQPRDFIDFLGVNTSPSTKQVVDHVIACAAQGEKVHPDVYLYLNRNHGEAEVLRLREPSWIPVTSGRFARPNQVFWGEHPFGAYRFRLPQDLLGFVNLFKRLGSKDTPNAEDARSVLIEIADQFGPENQLLDAEGSRVLMECWRILGEHLETEQINATYLAVLALRRVIPDDRHLLNAPPHMFLGDRPTLASEFGTFVQHNVIERAPGSWRAMVAAGVRPLSKAVRVHVAECENPEVDTAFQARLAQRLPLARRVVETHSIPEESKKRVELIATLLVKSTTRLELTYTLDAFNQSRTVGPKLVPAYYDPAAGTLYISRGGATAWSAISRELCYALYPELDAAQLAAGLKEVFSATSATEASTVLDDLGYARITLDVPVVAPDAPAVDLNGDPNNQGGGQPGATGSGSPPSDPVADAIANILGTGVPPPSPGPPEPSERTRRRLRSYVIPAGTIPQRQMSPEAQKQRDATAVRGVEIALQYERDHDREPKDLNVDDPNHQGCDIESTDANGEVRFIEVKAISGTWDSDDPAGLTNPQFTNAVKLGDHFWLYVIENTASDTTTLIRIQNPAAKVDQFLFDDGWRQIASDETPP